MTEKNHPLEDEDVLVSVVLEHVPTGLREMATVAALVDGGEFDISEATEEAKTSAMNKLLAAIEQTGG